MKSAVAVAGIFLCGVFTFSFIHKPQYQDNHAPVVKILVPKPGSSVAVNSSLPYSITVSDAEDGDSKFQEIDPNQVMLEVKFADDSAAFSKTVASAVQPDPPGLAVIRNSNCFNCHAFTSKLIGPSFLDISKKYAGNNSNIEPVAGRIKNGSSGIWGKIAMPTHPELSVEQCRQITKWIVNNAAAEDTRYYVGVEGSMHSFAPAGKTKGSLLLTASYTDHGIKDQPNSSLKGVDRQIVSIR